MSTMQNYLISRSPCGNQRCDDKPSDGSIQGKGRSNDKSEFKRILVLEEACRVERSDIHYPEPDLEWDVTDEAPFRSQSGAY